LLSDHLPLWAEFALDRSSQQLAQALELDKLPPDPARPNPLDAVPETRRQQLGDLADTGRRTADTRISGRAH
jgi:hypothetical protein